MVGAEHVAKSPPDGYTLLLGNIASLAINVGIYAKMPYDPLKDFTPIMHTIDVNYVLVVHPSVPAKSVAELVAYAKANPGKLVVRLGGQRQPAAPRHRALQGADRHRHACTCRTRAAGRWSPIFSAAPCRW